MKAKATTLLLAALLMFTFAGTAFAADTTAAVPVTLTVSNEYRAVNVTLPASLPVEVINGIVITANNAKITNNSKVSKIRVRSVSLTNGAYKVGNYEDFGGAYTIALKINGCSSIAAGKLPITKSAFPVIEAGESLPLTYQAKVSADAPNAEAVNAAVVVFTISLVD